MDEESGLEVVPLKSRLSFSSQNTSTRFLSSATSSIADSDFDKGEKSQLWQQAVGAVLFHFFGWYFPRYLASLDDTIEKRPPPYQQTAAGDVILDPLLNQPFVYPPTVGCKSFNGKILPLFF